MPAVTSASCAGSESARHTQCKALQGRILELEMLTSPGGAPSMKEETISLCEAMVG